MQYCCKNKFGRLNLLLYLCIIINIKPIIMTTQFQFNDGGRALAGFKGSAGDCVCRAISIASGKPYAEVYDYLSKMNASQRMPKGVKRSRTASKGINVNRKWFKDYMNALGFVWIPTMQIGQGCKVHLRSDELPNGRLVCMVSKHLVAVIDGVINDTYDCSREGTRCVYGYYMLKENILS